MDLVAQAEAREEEARACFLAHDTDDSGTIDATELVSVFRTLGLKRAEQDEASFEARVGRCLSEHDTNADGVLSFDEFKRLYNVIKGVAVHRPRASRLTTGVTLAFLRDLPGVIAKLEFPFPEVRSLTYQKNPTVFCADCPSSATRCRHPHLTRLRPSEPTSIRLRHRI